MTHNARRQIWIHSLGAKVGGGITYLRAILPELALQLEGHDIRVVLLVPGPLEGVALPGWFDVRPMPGAARSAATRLLFDQTVLPAMLRSERRAVLFCSGSFSPLVKSAPTVALLRNAIHFDEKHLAGELPSRRASYRAQSRLIVAGARRCAAVLYPSRSMRDLVEASHPELAPRGMVNYYGISPAFREAGREERREPAKGAPRTFLYVMNYTLQKNLGYLLRALAAAREAALPVRVVVTSRLDSGSPASFAGDRELIERNDLVGSGYLVPAGPKYGAELVDLYRSVDACVFPSTCESFGHPLVEAMAMGKPLVCADRPYARELCGEHAVYVDPDRPEELVDVWRHWSATAESLPRAPLGELDRRFSWSDHVARLSEVLLGA